MRPLIGILLSLDDRGRWKSTRDYHYIDAAYEDRQLKLGFRQCPITQDSVTSQVRIRPRGGRFQDYVEGRQDVANVEHVHIVGDRFELGREDIPDRLEEPSVVEPIDSFERRELDLLDVAPRPSGSDLFGFE